MLDDKELNAKLAAVRAAGGEVPDDIEARLRAGETVAVTVRADAPREALAHGLDLEGTGNAVVAIACDTTDDPAHIARLIASGPTLRLIAVKSPWGKDRTAERADWFVGFLRAGGGFSLAMTADGFEEAAIDGVQLFGLAEALNATGALSHTFTLGERTVCLCGCGEVITADDKTRSTNIELLARLHMAVLDYVEHGRRSGTPAEQVDIAGLYAVLQRRVMLPQLVPLSVSAAAGTGPTDEELRALVGHEVMQRMINGGGAWLMFAAEPLGGDGLASIVDVAAPIFGKADPLALPIVETAHRLIEEGMLTALEHDTCVPRAKTFSVGADRLTMLGIVQYDKLPETFGGGMADLKPADRDNVSKAARFAEVRYRGRAILCAASLDSVGRLADKALANKGQRTLGETASLAVKRAAGLLSALGEVDSGSHLPRGMAQSFLRAEQPAFGEGMMDLGAYGLGSPTRLFPSTVLRFAVGAMLIARKGPELAAQIVNDTQNACAVMAHGLVEQCRAGKLDGTGYIERSEQAACEMWWNAWHGQSAN